jgi:hypothetical protein
MNKLDELKKEIAENKKENKLINTLADIFSKKEIKIESKIDTSKIEDKLDSLLEKETKIEVQPAKVDFPSEMKVSNFGDIKIPEQKEVKIPEFPKEISIKEPKWFDLKGVFSVFAKDLKDYFATKIFKVDLSDYTNLKQPLSVRLVKMNKSGYYEGVGGGGSNLGITGENLATEKTLKDVLAATGGGVAYDNVSVDTSDPASIVITKKMGAIVVDVKTVNII